jgi:hypothetical protein
MIDGHFGKIRSLTASSDKIIELAVPEDEIFAALC